MGIHGLLPALQSIQKEKHISEFQGKTAGVDGLCWMHQGAYQCARELIKENPWQGLEKVIDYCVSKIKLLQVNGIYPIIVLDGARLPMKKRIEQERKKARQESRLKAEEYLSKGEVNQAIRKYMEAVEITSVMVYRLIQILKTMSVKYIVAPYEADSQLAYLFQSNKIDFVITEDSDLLAFGVTRVFFKMDLRGQGVEIDLKNLNQCEAFKMPPSKRQVQFTTDMLLKTCILNGCDYLESVKGVGFKKALRLVKENCGDIKAIIAQLHSEKFKVSDYYLHDFQRAFYTFKHQVIFDTDTKRQRYLQELPEIMEHTYKEYFGTLQTDNIAVKISEGMIDPDTLESFEEILRVQLEQDERKRRVDAIKEIMGGYNSRQSLSQQSFVSHDSRQNLRRRDEKQTYKDFSKYFEASRQLENNQSVKQQQASNGQLCSQSSISFFNDRPSENKSMILSQFYNQPTLPDLTDKMRQATDILNDQANTMQPLFENSFNQEMNIGIIKTIKKKSFLNQFVSPDRTRSDLSSCGNSQQANLQKINRIQQQSEFPLELDRNIDKENISNNIGFKFIKDTQSKPKVNVGLKRALINNSKIQDFFKRKE